MTTNESMIVYRHKNPSPQEINAVLGRFWGVCRNTPANRERYSRCISEKEYRAAITLALDRRNMDGAGI